MELGLDTPVGGMKLIDEVPSHDLFDIADRPPRRRRLTGAVRTLPANLQPRDRPDASAGVHRGRPERRETDRRLDSRYAAGETIRAIDGGALASLFPLQDSVACS